MNDDEIDAAIRAAVPAECFVPNAGAREIYRAGYRAGIEAAAKAVDRRNEGEESLDLAETHFCVKAIRALAD